MLLTVVDYGVGNLRSIAKSIEKANSDSQLNYSIKVSSDLNDVKKSDKIVLPGQGSFKACKNGINNIKGLLDELNESVLVKKKPIYGICAGMQLFATKGYEEGETNGLNWIPGVVVKLDISKTNFKIPHMGWNEVIFNPENESPLKQSLRNGDQFYFVHSYRVIPTDESITLTKTDYGGDFVSSISFGNCHATQFHPEKSQAKGLQIYRNFLEQ